MQIKTKTTKNMSSSTEIHLQSKKRKLEELEESPVKKLKLEDEVVVVEPEKVCEETDRDDETEEITPQEAEEQAEQVLPKPVELIAAESVESFQESSSDADSINGSETEELVEGEFLIEDEQMEQPAVNPASIWKMFGFLKGIVFG